MKVAAFALWLCLAIGVSAQEAPRVVALKAARMFDGTSNDLTTNAVVIVEGGRIKAVGAPFQRARRSSTSTTSRCCRASSTPTRIPPSSPATTTTATTSKG